MLSTTREISAVEWESISFVACVVNELVPGRHVQNPIRVDVESDLSLRCATWRWRDPIEMELPKQIDRLCACSAPCKNRVRHCKRIAAVAAAVAAAVVGVVAFARWKTTCSVLLSFLSVAPCSHFFLPCLSLYLLGKALRPHHSLSRACSAALLAARPIRRRPRAMRMCGPLSTRIHHAFLHHVMFPFDTSLFSCIEFVSFFSSTHYSCVVISSSPSCPSWASTSLSSSRSS